MVHALLRSATAALLLAAPALAQSPLTLGNLVVVRVGDGAAALSNASTPTFLDEYTPAGVLVQSIALPTAASGLNQPFTNSGTATSEGFLNVSANGFFLTLAGYAAPPGLAQIANTSAASTPRVVARIDFGGVVDTSTTIPDGFEGVSGTGGFAGNPRSVVSDDGFRFWVAGTGAVGTAGVRLVDFGAATSLGINAGAPNNCRVATIYHGQVYVSSASGSFQGVATVGQGLPTAPSQITTLLPGFPTAQGPSAYDHFFANPGTLYVADDRTIANGGGIQKWALVAGTWVLQYTLSSGTTSGCRGLTGFVQNGVTTLWATVASSPTQVVSIVDAGPGSVATPVAAAAANTAFRGIRYLATPSTLARLPATCGPADLYASGNAQLGTDVVVSMSNFVGIPVISWSTVPLGLPLCGCTFVHDFANLLLGPQVILTVPNNPAFIGGVAFLQGMDLFAPGGCPTLQFTLTDGYVLTVQQ